MRAKTAVPLFGLLVCLVLGLAAGAAADEDWKYVAMNEKGDRLFYDASSVIRLSRSEFELWTKKLGADGSSSRFLSDINCTYKIIRDKRRIVERPPIGGIQGLIAGDFDTLWRPMELDSSTLQLYKMLCR
jgi:hypothetical protein